MFSKKCTYLVEELKEEFFDKVNGYVEEQRNNGMKASTVIHKMDEHGWIEKTGQWEPTGTSKWEEPLYRKDLESLRDCKVCWFPTNKDDEKTEEFYKLFKGIGLWVNENPTGWFFDLSHIEDIQYTEYTEGQHYDWHIDTNVDDLAKVRKISFVVLLGDEFEGGELQIETRPELSKKEKEKFPNGLRYDTIPLKPGSIVFFHSDLPHRVTPVTSGVRRTLVGWFAGPHFK